MSKVDATLVVARDGRYWHEAHWLEPTRLDDPLTRYEVVEIRDGTGEEGPMICGVLPDIG